MIVSLVHHRFTADEYGQMIRSGILTKDDRVELIEGEIIEMSPIGERHAACVDRLTRFFVQRLGDRAVVRVQGPIRLSDTSQPQPDLVVFTPRSDLGHPRPGDIVLVIEVADTTQEMDRDVKLPLYARAGVAEAWLVDLKNGVVEVCRRPGQGGYGELRRATRGEKMAPAAFPDVDLAVDQILV